MALIQPCLRVYGAAAHEKPVSCAERCRKVEFVVSAPDTGSFSGCIDTFGIQSQHGNRRVVFLIVLLLLLRVR
jgi:hypothetical protein